MECQLEMRVFRFARERNIPLVMLTSGASDTVSCTLGCSATCLLLIQCCFRWLYEVER